MGLVECVPNFSEGRRPEVVEKIVSAILSVPGVALLDRESDPNHNRAVVTFAGEGEAAREAAFRGIAEAQRLIDLRHHKGEHPRMGASDVVPFIPLRGSSIEECVSLAKALGKDVGEKLGIPVYLYEAAATRPDRKNLADVRKGEFEGLREEIGKNAEKVPDFGPNRIHESAGATAIGARFFLVAYNVNLRTPDVKVAKAIAKLVREKDGGLPTVKALGFELADRKLAQVSMNLCDYRVTSIWKAYDAVSRHARERGVEVEESEVVGLVPAEALAGSAVEALKLARFAPDQVIEARIARSRGLADLPLGEFVSRLASSDPTPGGGSAAALAGALAAALAAMVVRLTQGKKKLAEGAAALAPLLPEMDSLARDLRGAIARDASAYDAVMAAFKLPKGTPAEQAARTAAVQVALRGAAAVPLEVAASCARVAELARLAAARGNPSALSDAACAAALAEAACEAASWNVLINAKEVADPAEAARLRTEAGRHRADAAAAAAATREAVAAAL